MGQVQTMRVWEWYFETQNKHRLGGFAIGGIKGVRLLECFGLAVQIINLVRTLGGFRGTNLVRL
jgi:hypothetical protein